MSDGVRTCDLLHPSLTLNPVSYQLPICYVCAPYSRSLRPKQAAHSSRAMYLSSSESHWSKKRVVQCSMGMRGARRGESSVWVRYLVEHKQEAVKSGNYRESENKAFCERSLLLLTRRLGAGRADRTASGRGRCTCCSSSRSRGPAGPESARQPAASSRSRRSSSPEGSDGRRVRVNGQWT